MVQWWRFRLLQPEVARPGETLAKGIQVITGEMSEDIS
jgi:hypothetical protein